MLSRSLTPFSAITVRDACWVEQRNKTKQIRTMRDGVDLGSLPDGLIGLIPPLGVDEVRGEDGVDESRLPETRLACANSSCVSSRAQRRRHKECERR